MYIEEPIKKSISGDALSKKDLLYLLNLAPDSAETYMVNRHRWTQGINRRCYFSSDGKYIFSTYND